MNLHTLLRGKTALAMALCAAACSHLGLAQVAAPSILQIDIANHVLYFNDTSDVAKYGTDPNAATTLHAGSFGRGVAIADIVPCALVRSHRPTRHNSRALCQFVHFVHVGYVCHTARLPAPSQ